MPLINCLIYFYKVCCSFDFIWKTTIINFTVSAAGLEDQLLVEVIRYERIELEEKRISLITEISDCKQQL